MRSTMEELLAAEMEAQRAWTSNSVALLRDAGAPQAQRAAKKASPRRGAGRRRGGSRSPSPARSRSPVRSSPVRSPASPKRRKRRSRAEPKAARTSGRTWTDPASSRGKAPSWGPPPPRPPSLRTPQRRRASPQRRAQRSPQRSPRKSRAAPSTPGSTSASYGFGSSIPRSTIEGVQGGLPGHGFSSARRARTPARRKRASRSPSPTKTRKGKPRQVAASPQGDGWDQGETARRENVRRGEEDAELLQQLTAQIGQEAALRQEPPRPHTSGGSDIEQEVDRLLKELAGTSKGKRRSRSPKKSSKPRGEHSLPSPSSSESSPLRVDQVEQLDLLQRQLTDMARAPLVSSRALPPPDH